MTAFLRLHRHEDLLIQWQLATERFCGFNHDARIPVLFIAKHGPSEDRNLASQCDGGLLLAGLLFTADSIVNALSPRVVAKGRPSAFDEDRSGQRIASFGDSTVAIGLARLILSRYESEISRDLATVLEAVRIINAGYKNLGGTSANAGDRSKSYNARIVLTDRFKLLDDNFQLLVKRIQLRQFDIELSFPEFVRGALIKRLAKGVDSLATGVPSFLTGIDGDAMVDEPSTDGALHLVGALVERFPILDEGSEFSMFLRRHVNGYEFVHGSHAGELKGVVFVCLAFDVGPTPSIFVGGADESFESETHCKIVDPSGGSTSFHDDEVDLVLVLFEDGGEVVSIGGRVKKRVFSSFGVEKAAHGIELTEVESENFHSYCPLGLGLEIETDVCASELGSESPDFIRKAPTPNPGLTWILSS